MSNRKLLLRLVAASVIGLLMLGLAIKESTQLSLFSPQAALAQSIRPEDVWQIVYQQLPDLPRENQYVSKETRKVNPDNTLVSRIIRYHIYTKGRSPNYRLDWKLTLADYLGVNELMEESQYPGYDTLRKNPVEGDIAAIKSLNRKQRDALVQVIVSIFDGSYTNSTPSANTSQEPSTPRSPQP